MLKIEGLTKKYGKVKAVDNISFEIKKGEILGFLGPNGAGKTTTMNILTGYLSYTNGSIQVDGLEVVDHPMEIKKKIGYLPENPPLYLDMTVMEYLKFVFELKKVKENRAEYLDKIMETVDIKDVQKRLIKNLSKGYKQRVGLAQALIGDPEILVLDEPTVGLDPKQIIEIRNLIKHLGKKRTVILSSHILPEVSAVCERIIIINNGKIVAEGTTDDLQKAFSNQNKLMIRISGDEDKALRELKNVTGVKFVEKLAHNEKGSCDYLVEAKEGADIRKSLFNKLAEKDLTVLMLQPYTVSLEDVFIGLTGKTFEQAENTEIADNTEAITSDNTENLEETSKTVDEEKSEERQESKDDGNL